MNPIEFEIHRYSDGDVHLILTGWTGQVLSLTGTPDEIDAVLQQARLALSGGLAALTEEAS